MDILFNDIKHILSIQIKPRHDGIFDQYSRIFMPKILLLSSIAVGVNWYVDKLTCTKSENIEFSSEFINEACWINGFYIYKNMTNRMTTYYGIPEDITRDGLKKDGSLCTVTRRSDCIPMEKLYYIQYQWFPFFIASLMILYFIPYTAFKIVNTDLISLKNAIKTQTSDDVFCTYFNKSLNSTLRVRCKIFINFAIKIAYIFSNVATLLLIDYILNGGYLSYARNWFRWTEKTGSSMLDYSKYRSTFRAGEILLPSFGLCDIQEQWMDKTNLKINKHKFICEFSAHVLYHYVLILLWFFVVFGIISSALGLFFHATTYLLIILPFAKHSKKTGSVLKALTLREQEYLEYIHSQNTPLYGLIINKLRQERFKDSSNVSIEILKQQVLELSNQLHKINRG
uniref:Innexin n=1 Tax=Hydra vulgaris TaxID=6087 RepID=A0A0H5FN97_HYDVU|nr:Innexin 10 [Hydra vulgaris]